MVRLEPKGTDFGQLWVGFGWWSEGGRVWDGGGDKLEAVLMVVLKLRAKEEQEGGDLGAVRGWQFERWRGGWTEEGVAVMGAAFSADVFVDSWVKGC